MRQIIAIKEAIATNGDLNGGGNEVTHPLAHAGLDSVFRYSYLFISLSDLSFLYSLYQLPRCLLVKVAQELKASSSRPATKRETDKSKQLKSLARSA
ncbi:hypothetical protein ROHU_014443 [Labeo rohita]|uniref:Uncharacterized protein n=1 Tax=Labeo rohita TaxID=84645 RepID=A0A498NUI1_LABRO|nr:hypothetical protein ROHU_014443 [Labeo rohita]